MGARYLVSGVQLGMILGVVQSMENISGSDIDDAVETLTSVIDGIMSDSHVGDSSSSLEEDIESIRESKIIC